MPFFVFNEALVHVMCTPALGVAAVVTAIRALQDVHKKMFDGHVAWLLK